MQTRPAGRIAIVKFICSAGFAMALLAIGLLAEDASIKGGAFGFFLLIGIPVFILGWIDFGQALRKEDQQSKSLKFWGRVFGYPQAAFGLVCAVVGLIIIPLLLYKWWKHGQAPQGPWLTAPFGFLAFGSYLMKDAFRPPKAPNTDLPAEHTGN